MTSTAITIIPGTAQAQDIGVRMLARELSFEINTGMKRGRNYNPIQTAKSLGFKGRTKIDALKWVISTYEIVPEPGDSITKALAKHGLEVVVTA